MSEEYPVRVGDLLRKARLAAGISQLELSLRLDVSQRHVSFVERGRSRPGRALLDSWLGVLEAPIAVRNAILLHAGYTSLPVDTVQGVRAESVDAELERIVEVHNPFPAFLFDSGWRMTALNEGGRRLCGLLMPDYWRSVKNPRSGMDMIDTVTHPDGLLSQMDNAPVVATVLLRQLRAEVWAHPGLQERVDAYEKSVRERFGIDIGTEADAPDPPAGMMKFEFTTAHGPLSFQVVQSAVGLPQNITIDSLRVELWFPADEHTRETVLRSLM